MFISRRKSISKANSGSEGFAIESMEQNQLILSLQNLLRNDTLDMSVAENVSQMIRREKEKQVLIVHKYKICGPFNSRGRQYYRTTAPWLPSKRLNRLNYDDIIEE